MQVFCEKKNEDEGEKYCSLRTTMASVIKKGDFYSMCGFFSRQLLLNYTRLCRTNTYSRWQTMGMAILNVFKVLCVRPNISPSRLCRSSNKLSDGSQVPCLIINISKLLLK